MIDLYSGYNYDAFSSQNPAEDGLGSHANGHSDTQNHDHDLHDSNSITQEDCWQVISAFFNERNLVSQQISSFDGFVNTTMQELVEETGSLVLEQSMQYTDKAGDSTVGIDVNTLHLGLLCLSTSCVVDTRF